MKRVLFLSLILGGKLTLACNMVRSQSETQIVIDPVIAKVFLESKKDLSQFEISGCDKAKFIAINASTAYYETDTLKKESNTGVLLDVKNNCSIDNSVNFKKVESDQLKALVRSKAEFLKTCISFKVSDASGQEIKLHADSKCELKKTNATDYLLSGQNCVLATNPRSILKFSTQIHQKCTTSTVFTELKLIPQDIDSVIRVWPTFEINGKLEVANPIGQRNVRFTLLPPQNLLPRIENEMDEQPFYTSILSTNINPGSIKLRAQGTEKTQLTPTFLIENLANSICKNEICSSVSNFTSVFSGQLKLNLLGPNGKADELIEWSQSVKIPAHFSGLAEVNGETNLSFVPNGAISFQHELKPGQTFELLADFFEPLNSLELNAQSDVHIGDLLIPEISNSDQMSNLPQLPELGKLKLLDKLPGLPSISIGSDKLMELFTDKFNMRRPWTHHYAKVCNFSNSNCHNFAKSDSPFIQLKIKFKTGPNNEVVPISIEKRSSVFESYSKTVTQFASKVCQ